MSTRKISVLVFEDNDFIREGLRLVLNQSTEHKCIGAYRDCTNLIERIKRHKPDVILMDIVMPEMSGIEGVSVIRSHNIQIPVIMQTSHEDDDKVFGSIVAGANGYVLKTTTAPKLLEYISDVYVGGSPMSPSIATKVLGMFKKQHTKADAGFHVEFSKREKEILTLLSDGLSYKQIASQLFISYETVHSHIQKIYGKLQVKTVHEAVSKAIRNKLV